jgi:hypothetical protein
MAEPQKPMAFLDSLNETQRKFADEIIEKSKQKGMDPRLSLALVYRESKFDPNAIGGVGEIGLGQIKPSTGKLMGYSEKDLKNPSKNIDATLQYLNQNLIKFNDPVLAVAGYNAGPDHPYFADPNIPLPDSTVNYVRDIKNLGGFTQTPAENTSAGSSDNSGTTTTPASEEDLRKQKAAMIGGLGGFGVGAAQTMFGGATPQGGVTTNATTPGGKYAAKTGYGLGEGSTREAIERYKKYAPQPLGEQMFSGDAKKSSMGAGPRSLQVVPGTQAPLSINRQVPTPPPTPALQTVRQGVQSAGNMMGRAPVVPGLLGGASAGYQGQEAFDRYQKGDMTGATIAGVGALGGLASMLPNPATRALGALTSVAAPSALTVLDAARKLGQQPRVPVTEGEMRMAQQPAFMSPNMRRP